MDPAADVAVEVEVGIERETTELDHRAHRVAEDSEYPCGGLDRTAGAWDLRLTEVVGKRLVDEPLVVITGRVARRMAEEQGLGVETSIGAGKKRHLGFEAILE